jgi:hypothetical protein
MIKNNNVLNIWHCILCHLIRHLTLLIFAGTWPTYSSIHRNSIYFRFELWGCASSSNIEILQRYQSKVLRLITQAPCYVANHVLHRHLGVATVRDIFQAKTTTHRTALAGHPNPLMRPLLAPPPPRSLKSFLIAIWTNKKKIRFGEKTCFSTET